jgi:hypothetical protein
MVTMVDSAKTLTYPDLCELLAEFNADAKTLSRRGYCGTATVEYADAHASIDSVLSAMGL